MILTDFLIISFLIPLYKYYQKPNKNGFENSIAFLLVMLIGSYILEIKSDNPSHKLNNELIKILLVLIPIYILFYKQNVDYCTKEKVVVLLILGTLLYQINSKNMLNSNDNYSNITPRVLFHVVALIGASIAFS
jgi:hypothetical protein